MKKAIEIKDLSYSYPDGTPALAGLTLDVYEGEPLGVIGPNGAGKTTLLFHMNGILQSDSGISVVGLSMCRDNLKRIRSKVGFVFHGSTFTWKAFRNPAASNAQPHHDAPSRSADRIGSGAPLST
jgi:ABC-type multidrug transport system ATPase subunit